MGKFVPAFARFVIRFRYAILVVCLVLLALSIWTIGTDFRLAQNIKDDLPLDDPQIIAFNEFVDQFGESELMVVALGAKDVFAPEILSYLRLITQEAEKYDRVEQVISLTNVQQIRGADGVMEIAPFFPAGTIPTDPVELLRLRRLALDNPFWVNSLVSAKGDALAVNLKLPILTDDAKFRFAIVDRMQAFLDTHAPPPGVEVHFTGVSVFGRDSIQAMKDDLFHYIWLMPVLVLILLFVVFKTLRGVLIPQVIIFISVCFTLAILFAVGKSITMISTMLPVLIGVIAISDIIHVIARYYELSQTIEDRTELVQTTMERMIPPCFLTSTTTAAGFAALMISDLTQVRDFGLFAAIGLIVAFIVAMTIGPIILSFLPVPRTKIQTDYANGVFHRLLEWVNAFTRRDRFVTPVLAVVLMAGAIYGITHVKVETTLSKFLPQDKPSVAGLHWLQDKMAGVTSLEMTLRGEPGVFKEPWALAQVGALQRYVESLPESNKAFSVVDFVRTFNKVLHDDDPAFDRIPETRQAVAQYLLLFEMTGEQEMLERFVNADYSYTRISARIRSLGSAGHTELIEHIEKYASTQIDPRLKFETTGMVVLYASYTTALVKGQINSLIIAFFIITLMMIVHLRSLKIGLLSMVPNLMPVVLTIGVMGMMDISLNVATVMIACIALGIAVDDTIHYLSRYGEELRAGKSIDAAMERTIFGAGRGMIFTSLVITGGFFVLCFSSFHTNRAFGILTGITMITAVFADLLVLPVLIRTLKLGR